MMDLASKKCPSRCTDWGTLILRLALGAVFFYHGYDKIFVTGIPAVTGFMESLGLPLPTLMAYLVSYGELIGGALLILGLLTYWAAILGVIISFVAFVTVHADKGFALSNGGYEYIMLIFAASIAILFSGAGKYSCDSRMMKNMKNSGMNQEDSGM